METAHPMRKARPVKKVRPKSRSWTVLSSALLLNDLPSRQCSAPVRQCLAALARGLWRKPADDSRPGANQVPRSLRRHFHPMVPSDRLSRFLRSVRSMKSSRLAPIARSAWSVRGPGLEVIVIGSKPETAPSNASLILTGTKMSLILTGTKILTGAVIQNLTGGASDVAMWEQASPCAV